MFVGDDEIEFFACRREYGFRTWATLPLITVVLYEYGIYPASVRATRIL